MTIKSKIHEYGHEHESEWPSKYGTLDKGTFHIDKQSGECVEGYPPDNIQRFGVAPTVIFDSMPPTYHEKECRVVESRSEWEMLDKAHNCITFGNKSDASPKVDEANEKKKRKAELRKASLSALQAYRANPQEVEQKMIRQAETQNESYKEIVGKGLDLKQTIKEHI